MLTARQDFIRIGAGQFLDIAATPTGSMRRQTPPRHEVHG